MSTPPAKVQYYETERVKLRLVTKGAVRVNVAHIHRKSHDIACIYVDLHSKYIKVGGACQLLDDGPGVCLEASAATLRTSRGVSRSECTIITFPAYMGWSVFSAEAGTDTVAVTLVKDGPLVLVPRREKKTKGDSTCAMKPSVPATPSTT